MYLKNVVKHFLVITKHRWVVFKLCCKVGQPWRGLVHDLSKYSPAEFIQGVRFFKGDRSPNEAEREEFGFSSAWLHHKGRNRHHFEYWTDYNPKTKRVEPVKMPIVFVKEMFCDRLAASKIYQGKNYTDSHPIEYFRRGRANRSIHPETSELLESWLVMLAEKGEKETFRHIRSVKKY